MGGDRGVSAFLQFAIAKHANRLAASDVAKGLIRNGGVVLIGMDDHVGNFNETGGIKSFSFGVGD